MIESGKSVLIVEHNDDQRHVLSRMLENEGYRVHQVSEECLALEELKRRRFDVVISAHHIPQINGFRLILLVRLLWPGLPTILLLHDETQLSPLAEQGRAYGILRKPYVFSELLELMRNAIRSTREPRSRMSKPILLSS
ncbi:MAG: response regulator [Nitrospira sp.]|nr:response regulator [Nitrospira sp.]